MRGCERSAASRSRLAIAPPSRRSCDAGDWPAFSSHASQNAASAERESETGAGRFAPGAQGLFATALAVRGLSSINAISPRSAPGPAVSNTKSPRKMSTSPSNKTYILSPFSPSRNRKSPGASCTVLLSCRNSSAGFIGQNQLLAAIERSATTAKLQLCDRRLRHLWSKFLSFVCFVVNSLCHSERLSSRSAGEGAKIACPAVALCEGLYSERIRISNRWLTNAKL